MPFAAPSQSNVFVPPSIARELTIDYARDPSKFALNRYMERRPVKKRQGYYLKINPDEKARSLYEDAREDLWPDGSPSPSDPGNTPLFDNVPYATKRRRRSYTRGDLATEQADHDLQKSYANMTLQQVMTRITRLATVALRDASWGDNAAAVATLIDEAGAYLDLGSPTNPILKNALLSAKIRIEQATVGQITGDDLVLLMNPSTARRLAITQEIHTYVKESPIAQGIITGKYNSRYGLPDQLYGHELVIENAVMVTSRKGASSVSRSYILPEDTIYLVSRPGGIEGTDGTPVKSTLCCFFYTGGEEGKDYDGAEFDIEEFYDSENRLTRGHVTYDLDIQVTTTLGGFKMTGLFEPASS